MGFLDMTKKLLRTSDTALDERYKSPEAVLDRYIGELKNNLESARAALTVLRAEMDRMNNRARELKADEGMWEQKARAALTKLNDEDMAREALRRKAAAAAEYKELDRTVAAHARDIDVMEKSLAPLETKIADAHAKKERLAARLSSQKARTEIKARLDESGIGDFKEVEEQLLELEAQAETLGDLKLLSVKEAYRPMPEVDEIEKELERLRKEVKK